MSINSKMTAIADAIRLKTGGSSALTLDGMASALNSVPVRRDVAFNGGSVVIYHGFYPSTFYKNIPSTTQATPSITIDASGLITARATQTRGYVTGGTTSATKQLSFQEAKTITPSLSSQVAVYSGFYTGGNIVVESVPVQQKTVTPKTLSQNVYPDSGKFLSMVVVNGSSNLTANNIKSGVTVFGVTGTYAGNTSLEDGMITRTFSTYSNNRVTNIGAGAFAYCTNLTSVNIPKATYIGSHAFEYCTSLPVATFNSAKTIGTNAFYYCTNLSTINAYNVTSIGDSAFACCYSLNAARFQSATIIGNYAFASCYRISSISFPMVTSIGNSAFTRCSSVTGAYFPAAETIGNYAFASCNSIVTASFPMATSIGNSAFASCTKLTTASFAVATDIGNGAFVYCTSLTTINMPVVETINMSAFTSCYKLTSLSLSTVKTIGSYAFNSCSSLYTARFSAAEFIGSGAFQKCFKLKSLYLLGSSICTLAASNAFTSTPIGGYSTSAGTYGSIYVPASLLSSYKTATNWSYFSRRIKGLS